LDVYKASVSWDTVTIVKDASQFPFVRIWLMTTNVPPGGAFVDPSIAVAKGWAIRAQLFQGVAEYRAEFTAYWFSDLIANASFANPDTWESVTIDVAGVQTLLNIQDTPGSNGVSITGGGTMSIEKDEAAGVIRFICPLGTMVASLHYTGGVLGVTDFDEQNSNGLYFSGHGHVLWRPGDPGVVNFDVADTVRFYDAINETNGTPTLTVDMSSADPGLWYPTDVQWISSVRAPPFYHEGHFGPMLTDDAQEATRYRMKTSWTTTDDAGTGVGLSTFTQHTRILSNGGTGQEFRDLTHAVEHGPLWATYVLPADTSKIRLRTTYDNFHSSTVTDAYDNALSANETPNINWYNDRLWLTWYDGTVVKQSFSQDMGVSWSTPVDLMISGTNPRHLVDTSSGTSFYFYIDSAQSLVLKRSGDFGKTFWDLSAITVEANVGLQTVAAEFTSAGELVVGWIDSISGDWTQLKSQDRGASWI